MGTVEAARREPRTCPHPHDNDTPAFAVLSPYLPTTTISLSLACPNPPSPATVRPSSKGAVERRLERELIQAPYLSPQSLTRPLASPPRVSKSASSVSARTAPFRSLLWGDNYCKRRGPGATVADARSSAASSTTDRDGRASQLLDPAAGPLPVGVFKMIFETGKYFDAKDVKTFYPRVEVRQDNQETAPEIVVVNTWSADPLQLFYHPGALSHPSTALPALVHDIPRQLSLSCDPLHSWTGS